MSQLCNIISKTNSHHYVFIGFHTKLYHKLWYEMVTFEYKTSGIRSLYKTFPWNLLKNKVFLNPPKIIPKQKGQLFKIIAIQTKETKEIRSVCDNFDLIFSVKIAMQQ